MQQGYEGIVGRKYMLLNHDSRASKWEGLTTYPIVFAMSRKCRQLFVALECCTGLARPEVANIAPRVILLLSRMDQSEQVQSYYGCEQTSGSSHSQTVT